MDDPAASCTITPQQEDQVYGLLIAGQCYPIINAPKLPDTTGWLIKLAGILISGLAASPGSPPVVYRRIGNYSVFVFDAANQQAAVGFDGVQRVAE